MNYHKANFLQRLSEAVGTRLAELGDESQAFSRVAAEWLGYDLPDEQFVDGARDRGIDFWFQSDTGFDIFQVKSRRLKEDGQLDTEPLGSSGVADLRRIRELLALEGQTKEANVRVQHLLRTWKLALSTRRMAEEPEPIRANMYFVAFADSLTSPAEEEFASFSTAQTEVKIDGVPVLFNAHVRTINDLIDAYWRQSNQEWKDRNGSNRNQIDLFPETDKQMTPLAVQGHNSAVFYCRAIDLVRAFEDFGYQIFEPNVRAHIKKSKVNAQIRASILHYHTRKQFRYLNNGVTVVCKGFQKPSANRACFRVTEPGVINGLQTVVAIHEAYSDLDQKEREDFESGCHVLLRLLTETAVPDVSKVVLATNTQNPMQARNLRSNNEEQILYERLFADLGWFYERKQGAWDAFSGDPSRWRTLSRFGKSQFQYSEDSTRGRKRIRRIDNEELAQSWLSFIGLSDEAVHRKREIFDNEELYQLSFLCRPKHQAEFYKYDREKMREDSSDEAPDPSLMLASHLIREFAKGIPLSTREAREEAMSRLSIPSDSARETVDARLNDDSQYLRTRVHNGMSFMFVELVGYVLFSAFGQTIHYVGKPLLSTSSLQQSFQCGAVDDQIKTIRNMDFPNDDVIAVIWHAFDHIIDELLSGSWKESYLTAATRSHFNYSRETRSRIIKSLKELDAYMKRSQLAKRWTAAIPPNKGLIEYVKEVLETKGA